MSAEFASRPVAAVLAFAMFAPAALLTQSFWMRNDRRGLAWLVGLAVVVRMPLFFAPPLWSHDVYRYVWDGGLALRGIDPRAIAPDDPALAAERGSALWPAIDLRTIPTVYPPLAIGVFALAAAFDRDDIRAAKSLVLLADGAAIAVLIWALGRRGLPRGRAALYALHPLVLISFAQDGHIEAFAVAGIIVALFAGQAPRVAALAFAILMKLYPAILLPLIAARDRRVAVATLALVAVAYVPSLHGGHIAGSLGNYLTAQGFNASFGLLGAPAAACILAVAIAIVMRALARGVSLAAGALVVVVVYLLCTPNVLPWYLTVVPALVAVQQAPFRGRFAALAAAIVAWSGTVSLAYAVPWLALQGSGLDVGVRLIEYSPLVAGALIAARSRQEP